MMRAETASLAPAERGAGFASEQARTWTSGQMQLKTQIALLK